MPKWTEHHNPIDDPSLHELREGKELSQRIDRDLSGIQSDLYEMLDNTQMEEYRMPVHHPDGIFDGLAYLEQDAKPLPQHEREDFNERINKLKTQAFYLYPRFYKDEVARFGYAASRGRHVSAEDIRQGLETSIHHIRTELVDPAKTEKLIFDIEELNQKLENYEKEPMYYVFEREAEKLSSELYHEAQELLGWYGSSESVAGLSDSGEASRKRQKKLSDYRKSLENLRALENEMHDADVKAIAQGNLKSLGATLNSLEVREGAPTDLARLENRVGRMVEAKHNGEDIDEDELDELIADLEEFEIRSSAYTIERAINKRAQVLKNIVQQLKLKDLNDIPDAWLEMLRLAERTGDLRSAYSLLGISEVRPGRDVIKKKYRELALKYHTDMNENINREKIQMINAAMQLIKNVWAREDSREKRNGS
ncbi:MAG: J domain-containing protein [Candidatus Uhrbacteria bacterium]|nr:J domain-containing protein [Candidatus Uhrbacteria bacterium]